MSEIKALAKRLKAANKVVVFTGAGVSVASGVPTFRDPGGLWDKYSPQELANEEAFRRDPCLVWAWYQWRRKLILDCEPNEAHLSLAKLETMISDFLVVSQNVDGLHQRAGSKNIKCLHGDIFVNRCLDCKKLSDSNLLDFPEPVSCESCGSLYRPGVVWFGESLDKRSLQDSWRAAERCDLFLSVGTAASVQPAASLIEVAKEAGAYVVELNPNGTYASAGVDLIINEPSEVFFPKLLKAFG
ncbi:MAG: NAD-dependent deacylase [Bdellovibrionota bacterium]|nr:NAD-dependent protein deacylase [Pseudobdellovibrionaceae bacterium]|tara:strand:- start:68967 stop:69695 length:729 start_codon:yes stop_codon:yes gene_type:complete